MLHELKRQRHYRNDLTRAPCFALGLETESSSSSVSYDRRLVIAGWESRSA